jgi:hypothetical protein
MIKKITNGKIPFFVFGGEEFPETILKNGKKITDIDLAKLPKNEYDWDSFIRFSELAEQTAEDYAENKDSLISLLKDNDIWLKYWIPKPNESRTHEENDTLDFKRNTSFSDVYLIKIKE